MAEAAPTSAPQIVNFTSPYNSSEPLENFLVFSAPPRPDVPDGQIHWVDAEVPGIDVLGPDGDLHNMCPEEGLAWTLQGGDPFGGGTFVAVECQGRATGWQMLAFHLCQVGIEYSINMTDRVYTRVAPGQVIARECLDDHTHLSLGYWADQSAKLAMPCPQWYVQGRYWVNAACLIPAGSLPPALPRLLIPADDWELRYLRPEVLNPLKRFAFLGVGVSLTIYVILGFVRAPIERPNKKPDRPKLETALKTGVWIGFLLLLVFISAGPLWPVARGRTRLYTADSARYQAMARAVGYEDWELLQAFYLVAVARDARGRPVQNGEPGKVFPPAAAAAIPFGETNAAEWDTADPTQPGPYGQYRAWDAVAKRWPVSLYERIFLGLEVSRQAQRQREGLEAIADSPALRQLGRQLGKTLRAQDLYGSSAGAVGRTQVLPGHFASGGICADMATLDVWNDPLAIAECTTRYLTTSGCWGSWWVNGDVWSALCSYNPGAWNRDGDRWYWDVLQDRMTRLEAAEAQINLGPTGVALPIAAAVGETVVPTPVLGLLISEALLQEGQTAYGLPGPLNRWLLEVAPQMRERQGEVRAVYRLFRAWTLIYYSPEELLTLGIQL